MNVSKEGKGTDTPIGVIPTQDALDLTGLEISEENLLNSIKFDADEWHDEIPMIEEWFEKFGDKLPTAMSDELEGLKDRLGLNS